jgi:hypothetical protein
MKALKSLQSCDVRFVLGFDIDIALAPSEKDLKKCKTSLLAFSRPSPV